MEHFKPPGTLSFEGNLSENWRRWSQRFDLYLKASGGNEKDEATQVAILLHTMGEEGLEIFNTFTFDEAADKDKINNVTEKFTSYCNPRNVMERYTFWEKCQREGESIDQFVTSLKNHAKNCEFGDQKDLMIRDRIIFGVRDTKLKERLLRDSADPKLDRVVELCRASEASSRQLAQIGAGNTVTVNALNKRQNKKHKKKLNKTHKTPSADTANPAHQSTNTQFDCGACGRRHGKRECPAYGETCMNCYQKHHFKKMCRNKKKVHTLEEQFPEPMVGSLFIGEVQIDEINNVENAWYAYLKLSCSKDKIKFKLDTGAEANVLPRAFYDKLPNKPQLMNTRTRLTAYGGHKLEPAGRIVKSEFSKVFKGVGKFKGEYRIEIDKTVKPQVQPPRKVAFGLLDRLKETITRLKKEDVLASVDEPTEWVNSLVIVEKKNGALRLCLDPRDLNTAIKREHFRIPTPEDVAADLHDKKVFSILDKRDGYWHVQLDHESSLLCCFNTPFGRYRFKRMPFGICSASEVFQKKNHRIFGDIQGVHMIADDMIIAAENEEEHDKIVRKVMERAIEQNVKFNADKIQFKVDTVEKMGHVITQDGLKPDEKKIQAIRDMPKPEDNPALQRLLGMVNYLSKFIPRMSEITAPLRLLLKNETPWFWDDTHDRAIRDIKQTLTKSPVLKFFDPAKPITNQADASQNGLGACLLQDKQPIAYASRSLTSAERNYAQIEKELLAVVFACDKFHQYIYGMKVEVQSDHKPLEAIIQKPLVKASPRLQRMLLCLQRYQISITYTPGKLMFIADTLSRAYLTTEQTEQDKNLQEDMNVMIHGLVANLAASKSKVEQLQEATERDTELQNLISVVMSGWPENKAETHTSFRQYINIRDEIHTAKGLVFCGERLIIPREMRKELLNTLYTGLECRRKLMTTFQGVQHTIVTRGNNKKNLSFLMRYPREPGKN